MKRYFCYLPIVVILFTTFSSTGIAHAKGQLIDTSFYSSSLDTTRLVDVYLPAGYDSDDSTRYPVVYYLHGYGRNQNDHQFIIDSLDAWIANDKIEPIILVKPDGSAYPFQDWNPKVGWYANSELIGRFEDYIIHDLVNFIDAQYKTIAVRDKRCIMGFSMGGTGAMQLALKHPDIYCAVASHSGTLDLSWCKVLIGYANSNEYKTAPPFNYSPNAGFASLELFSRAAAYSPNLNNPPYFVDFVLDSGGNIIDSVWARWMSFNPKTLASALPPESNLHIYFDCGQQDMYGKFNYNVNFSNHLDSLGIIHMFQCFDGNHEDKIDRRFPISFAFLDSVIQSTATNIERVEESDKSISVPKSYVLDQNFPNPFNPVTTIGFELPVNGYVAIDVTDLLGRRIRTIISEYRLAGNHKVIWNGRDDADNPVATGVYLYTMRINGYTGTRKLVLIR